MTIMKSYQKLPVTHKHEITAIYDIVTNNYIIF